MIQKINRIRRKLSSKSSNNTNEKIQHNKIKQLEQKCVFEKGEILDIFNELDDESWATLLFNRPSSFPNLVEKLPKIVDIDLQKKWVGLSGQKLMIQTLQFYQSLKKYFKIYCNKEIKDAKILDYGWGRIIRFFLKDVPSRNLFAVDPDKMIISKCKEQNLNVNLQVSDWIPHKLPFNQKFDLIYSFSVFTHLSESTHKQCLKTLSMYLEDSGILIVTIRAKEFINFYFKEEEIRKRLLKTYESNNYGFVPHNSREPVEGEITFGDTIFSRNYIEKNWTDYFEIKDYHINPSTPHQTLVVLKKK